MKPKQPRKPIQTLLLTLASMVLFTALTFIGLFWLPAKVQYTITERYQFSVPDGEAHIYLGVMLPVSGPYQTVTSVIVLWDGERVKHQEAALNVYLLDGVVRDGGEVVVDFDFALPVGAVVCGAPVLDFQRMPHVDVESDHPEIVEVAAKIAAEDVENLDYNTYAFVSKYLSWPTGSRYGNGASALEALRSRVGGCNEFANLAVALYRANDIPAQTISGLTMPFLPPFVSKTQEWLHPAGAHAWVEIYTDDKWQMADPSWASSALMRWVYWGRNDGMHLSYGEMVEEKRVYQQIEQWATERGNLVSAMSAPNKFVLASDDADLSVTPMVTVKKGWDGRWSNVAILWGVAIAAITIGGRRELLNRQKRW